MLSGAFPKTLKVLHRTYPTSIGPNTTTRLPDPPRWNAVDHVTLSGAKGLAPASQAIRHVVQPDMARCRTNTHHML